MTDEIQASEEEGASLREKVETWLARQMPIVQMHGGTSAVRTADAETGEVVIELGGTCAGCGISEITVGNIEGQLYQEFEEITDVTVRTADVGGSQLDREGRESLMGIDLTEGGRGY